MKNILPRNCRKKHEFPLDVKCRAENIFYKCVASVYGYPNKVYLGAAESDFKQRFYNHQFLHSTFQVCLGNKGEVQDNAITGMVHKQIHTSLFKPLQEMSVVPAKKI